MARLYTDENFPLPVVELLRAFGHDVLTAREAGNTNLQIPEQDVLAFAIAHERAVVTRNRRHFIRLHQLNPKHTEIIVCTEDPNFEEVATRINQAISAQETLNNQLIRVVRPSH